MALPGGVKSRCWSGHLSIPPFEGMVCREHGGVAH